MIQDAVTAETVTSTYLETLDVGDRATVKLYVQKAAQATDEAWQHTVDAQRVTIPTVSELEHSSSLGL